MMQMTEADLVAFAEEKGWQDGAAGNPCSPPIRWQYSQDADEAYRTAYLHGMAYCFTWNDK